jgi:hypothetical protein
MAVNWQLVNINSGTTELPKYNATGVTTEIYSGTIGTGVVLTDLILGPVVQAGNYITDATIASDDLDSAASPLIQYNLGYIDNAGTYHGSAFIAAGALTMGTGGISKANVAASYGTVFTSNITMCASITATAGTAVAGVVRMGVAFTASP